MKHVSLRAMAVVLAFLLFLPACGKTGKHTAAGSGDHGDGWLTHVFRGTEFSLPGNYYVITADYV